jgi:hypothetical protein
MKKKYPDGKLLKLIDRVTEKYELNKPKCIEIGGIKD